MTKPCLLTLPVATFLLSIVLAAGPGLAEVEAPLEVTVDPGETQVTIPWSTLLAAGQSPESLHVGEQPRFGELLKTPAGYLYRPGTGFFAAGGDSFGYSVLSLDRGTQRMVVIAVANPSVYFDLADDAESGDLGNWTESFGTVTVESTAPITGDFSLRMDRSPYGAGSYLVDSIEPLLWQTLTNGVGTSNGHVGMVVGIDDPPGTGGSFANLDPLQWVLYSVAYGPMSGTELEVRVKRETNGDSSARVEHRAPSCPQGLCGHSPWLPVPNGSPFRLELFGSSWRTVLRITHGEVMLQGEAQGASPLGPNPLHQTLGIHAPSGPGEVGLTVDEFRFRRWLDQPAPQVVLADSFEDAAIETPWEVVPANTRAIEVASEPGPGGQWALAIDIDEVARQPDGRATLLHRQVRHHGFWGCSFSFTTDELNLANWQKVLLFGASSEEGNHGYPEHLRLWLIRQANQFKIWAQVRDDEGNNLGTEMLPLSPNKARHGLLLQWQAGSSGALRIWADDSYGEITGISNALRDIESIRLGAAGVVPELRMSEQRLVIDSWASWTGLP